MHTSMTSLIEPISCSQLINTLGQNSQAGTPCTHRRLTYHCIQASTQFIANCHPIWSSGRVSRSQASTIEAFTFHSVETLVGRPQQFWLLRSGTGWSRAAKNITILSHPSLTRAKTATAPQRAGRVFQCSYARANKYCSLQRSHTQHRRGCVPSNPNSHLPPPIQKPINRRVVTVHKNVIYRYLQTLRLVFNARKWHSHKY